VLEIVFLALFILLFSLLDWLIQNFLPRGSRSPISQIWLGGVFRAEKYYQNNWYISNFTDLYIKKTKGVYYIYYLSSPLCKYDVFLWLNQIGFKGYKLNEECYRHLFIHSFFSFEHSRCMVSSHPLFQVFAYYLTQQVEWLSFNIFFVLFLTF
jgi:hypothetical protein